MAANDGRAPESSIEPADGVGRVIVLDVVGLQPRHLSPERTPAISGLLDDGVVASLRPAFPALTVPAQTTLGTGQAPATHGDVASGEYDHDRNAVAFWARDRGRRTRLWEAASVDAGLTTGVLFFQHLIGTTADVAVTPSPIEDEEHTLIEMDCWTNPDGLYDDLREELGHFPLHEYWGPAAGDGSSRWILDAARRAVDRFDPDLLWVYVPHLDYAGLRSGPDSDEFAAAIEAVDDLVAGFLTALRDDDRWPETAVNVVSEYGFHTVEGPAFPNRALRDAGLLETRSDDAGGSEVDLSASSAFAVVDHQVAHVYTDDPDRARDAIGSLPGIDEVLDDQGKAENGIDHPNAGDLVLVADADSWFQYYWWHDIGDAPPYATDVDIHAKPGFDPCELFFGEDGLVTLDPDLVGGSHGRVGPDGFGIYGLGGPAAPTGSVDGSVHAVDVAPTIADMLAVADGLSIEFAGDTLLRR